MHEILAKLIGAIYQVNQGSAGPEHQKLLKKIGATTFRGGTFSLNPEVVAHELHIPLVDVQNALSKDHYELGKADSHIRTEHTVISHRRTNRNGDGVITNLQRSPARGAGLFQKHNNGKTHH
jgi:hypothetical protein